jgi:hypothetical protein
VDIVQAVGRVMRIAKGKKLGHVVVPVFVTEEQLNDSETAIESSAFEPVLAVLRALRAHDPELAVDATRIVTSPGRREAVASGYLPNHVHSLGVSVAASRFDEALRLRCVEVAADGWRVALEYLGRFAEREGHARVPQNHEEGGYRLGAWVNKRRSEHRRGALSNARSAALESFPGWVWDPRDDDWRAALTYLHGFVRRAGHAMVPRDHVENGYPLGAWVGNCRALRQRGQLSADHVAELDAIPGWTWDSRKERTSIAFALLHRFVDREGHARVPPSHIEDGFKLGQWVTTRRAAKRRGRLDAEQVQELERFPGWNWDTYDLDWQDGLAYLRRFVEREGHARPVREVRVDGYQLGRWVQRRRSQYRAGRLPADRVEVLEALPGWTWDANVDAWLDGLDHLGRYVQAKGNARVPAKHVTDDDYPLGAWVGNQRQSYKRGELDGLRVGKLEALPGWTWNPREDSWHDGIAHLVTFADSVGHARVPQAHVCEDGFRLGAWVAGRRRYFKAGKLTPDQIRELEAVPGWAWRVK